MSFPMKFYIHLVAVFAVLGLVVSPSFADDPVISEFLADNDNGLQDEDGDTSDWIEIHNPGDIGVNLSGWHLTDNINDLAQWTLPSKILAPGEFLVVFASSKDRTDAGAELHTNFKLSKDGEYLALVRPDLTVAHAFAPTFPRQDSDVSYGLNFNGRTMVDSGAAADVWVPENDGFGLTWTTPGFTVDELLWERGNTGIGYGLTQPGFEVTLYKANVAIGDISVAESVITTPSMQTSATTEIAPVINYLDTAGGAHYADDLPFPSMVIGSSLDDYALEATATVTLDQAGEWTFGVNSDDGFRLTLQRGATSFSMEHATPRGAQDTLQTFTITDPGEYQLRLTYYERGGGAEVEMFAAAGTHTVWGTQFKLIGDTANGGLPVYTSEGGPDVPIGLDVEGSMKGVNASAYVRLPFLLSDLSDLDSLTMLLRYNDGFVAYINGVEAARSNAPATLSYNASATATRGVADSLQQEVFNLSAVLPQLQLGVNVLALHGLNVSTGDDNFLLLPELSGGGVTAGDPAYLIEPTPGTVNAAVYHFGYVKDTKFAPDRGFYTNSILVEITTATVDAEIRYTTDGSPPTATTGTVYTDPVPISQTTVLRAAAFKPGLLATDVDTHTYLFVADVITQPATPAGFESYMTWGTVGADYAMDPDVVNDPSYSGTILEDLKSLPIMSLVMKKDDMFGGTGIYSNPRQSGVAWERAGSLELIYPDGRKGFQVNSGIRIHGGVGRYEQFFKHNFRFLFKSDYGPTKLEYPLFGPEATDEYDTFIIRAGFNNAWHRDNLSEELRAQYLRDEFLRRTLLDMGRPNGHGDFVHLYINGLYWGVYNSTERPSAPFCASYFGGDKEEWDALNSSEPVDGNKLAWTDAMNIANAGVADAAGYAALSEYVDIPNLIDYMLANFYGGNLDWDNHNWYSGRRRLPGEGYKFFSWDAERTLENENGDNKTGVNENDKPSRLYGQLRSNPEFLMQFADQAHAQLFNDGALTPAQCDARYRVLSDRLDRAIVGESARWGDSQHPDSPYTRNDTWIVERDRLFRDYFPRRTDVVLAQLRGAGLYPSLNAPAFAQHGGLIDAGYKLPVSAPSTIYYTLDGSDPRLAGGGISPSAQMFDGGVTSHTLLARGAVWKYLDNGSDQGTAWRTPGFDDSSWAEGPAELGYGDSDESTVVSFGPSSTAKYPTTYFRTSFPVAAGHGFQSLALHLKRDDGAIVYLNGTEVVRSNMGADPITYLTHAPEAADESTYFEYTVDPSHLVTGDNVLAVEIHQLSATSSDISLDMDLEGITLPVDGPELNRSTVVKARAFDGSTWSALNEALFVLDESNPLRVTEVMYCPRLPDTGEVAAGYVRGDFEYLELQNTGTATLGLASAQLTRGIDFDFRQGAVDTLAPGAYVVVVKNLAAFKYRYPAWSGWAIAGEYEGSLNDGGEDLELQIQLQGDVLDVDFDDGRGWPLQVDGAGHSLVPNYVVEQTEGYLDYGGNWRASSYRDGSPGREDPAPPADPCINEFAAHTDYSNPSRPEYDSNDWIELFNPGSATVSVAGWYLSDEATDLKKWQIPAGTTIAPGGWAGFNEINGFHNPITTGFGLNKAGEEIYLSYLPGTGEDRVADALSFKGQENGVTWGRYPDGAAFWRTLYPTPLLANSPAPPDVLITEIMFHPVPNATYPEDNAHDEYIELFNPKSTPVPLFNAEGSWRLDGELDYTFPPNITLPAGGYALLLNFNPTNTVSLAHFESVYGSLPAGLQLMGPYPGKLSNQGGRIALERPQAGDVAADPISWVVVDEVIYFDLAPWSVAADGTGLALQRQDLGISGNPPTNWESGLSSVGLAAHAPASVGFVDFDLQFPSRTLTWDALPGLEYTVQYSDTLTPPSWQFLGTVYTNGPAVFQDSSSFMGNQRHYRISRPR